MEIVKQLFLVFHIIGIASLLGGFLTQLSKLSSKDVRITSAFVHGAFTMLVTGLVLVGITEMGDDPVNHVKIAVKLVVLLAILVLVLLNRKKDQVSTAIFGTIGALTTANIFLAVMWT